MDALQTPISTPISRPMTPLSPETPLTQSLHIATSTMDELTLALTNFSHADPPSAFSITCCCNKEDCPNLTAWLAVKSRLESRLILSAEVGQALLQRHEAYVRQHEARAKQRRMRREREAQRGAEHPLRHQIQYSDDQQQQEEDEEEERRKQDDIDAELEELHRENQSLKKQLNQALVNNEVTEVSNKTILQELQEARSTISRMSAQNARSIGWDARVAAAIKEKEDMQQERDSESQRARLAESRFAALRDKTAKLQVEVRRLQEALEEKRTHRLESSESLLQDVRSKLEQQMLGRHIALEDDSEIIKVLESLVNDNDALKRDTAELQNLLTDAREEIHALQEEVDEQRANTFQFGVGMASPIARHLHTNSVPSVLLREPPLRGPEGRSSSAERPRKRGVEPLTPETTLHTIASLSPSHIKAQSSRPASRYSPSQRSFEIDPDSSLNDDATPAEPSRAPKPLLLLTRSRSVQTDPIPASAPAPAPAQPSPSPLPSHLSAPTPPDPYSEVSSFSDLSSSDLSSLLERASTLLTRMIQSDPLTLTHRLKRQNLKGADLNHLSRATISSISNEVKGLRLQFRSFLEDDKLVTPCTRKDARVLFKFLRDVFGELGKLRVTLNDVIIDPSCAQRVRMMAMDPEKADQQERGMGPGTGLMGPPATLPPFKGAGSGSWMLPISKLFGAVPSIDRPPSRGGMSSQVGDIDSASLKPSTRVVPKIPAALAATTTTVNVEFSGVGRSTTSISSSDPIPVSSSASSAKSKDGDTLLPTPPPTGSIPPSSSVMDIFAGAPRLVNANADPWVVIPRDPPVLPRFNHLRAPTDPGYSLHPNTPASPNATATVGRRGFVRIDTSFPRLPRNVEAVIDIAATPVLVQQQQQQQLTPRQRKQSLLGPRGQTTVGNAEPEPIIREYDVGTERKGDQGQEHDDADEAADAVTPLISGRPLRRRGLSDSSIRSTFLSQANAAGGSQDQGPQSSASAEDGKAPPTIATTAGGGDRRFFMNWPDGQSVFQALTKRMQNFRLTASTTTTTSTSNSSKVTSQPGPSKVPSPPPPPAVLLATPVRTTSPVPISIATSSLKPASSNATSNAVSPLAESTNVNHTPSTSLAVPIPIKRRGSSKSKGRRSLAASPSSQLLSSSAGTTNRLLNRNAAGKNGGNSRDGGNSGSVPNNGAGGAAGGGLMNGILSNWTAAGAMIDSDSAAAADPFLVGSVRDEPFMHWQRTRRPEESYQRDYL
ncbi:hypothetical protein AX16_007790 [Volvariella volvacea WC 439]|nr:hypothetical protein AX16_007790 [Volvariella volvacea WC 439]